MSRKASITTEEMAAALRFCLRLRDAQRLWLETKDNAVAKLCHLLATAVDNKLEPLRVKGIMNLALIDWDESVYRKQEPK